MKVLIVLGALCVYTTNANPRIIGGDVARAGEFPFSAAITTRTNTSQLFCGGSLWTNQWIITSAQCVDNAISFSIKLGSNHLTQNDPNRVIVSTNEFVMHPDYNSATLENDIALIKLRLPVEQNEYLRPIDLLPFFVLPDSQEVLAIGWGQTSDDVGGQTEQLNYVKLTTLSNDECRMFYGNQIVDNMVCVAGNDNEGTCTGDMGTPLIEYYSRQLTMHVGVATFVSGLGCESEYPSGYTRIYPYVSWIRDTTSTL